MTLVESFSLCQNLEVTNLQKDRSRNLLETIAQLLYEYSATVCIVEPDCIVIEIGTMLNYFGGLPLIIDSIEKTLDQWATEYGMALGPTALLAQWRAQVSDTFHVKGAIRQMRSPLNMSTINWIKALPLTCSRWKQEHLDRLNGLGFKSFDELYRLPSHAIKQHLGDYLYQEFGKAVGTIKHSLKTYVIPDGFTREIEFDREVEHSLGLIFPIKNILQALGVFMRRRRWKLYELSIELKPAWKLDNTPATVLLNLRHDLGSDDVLLWLELVELKLQKLLLPVPIRQMALRADKFESSIEYNQDLFHKGHHQKQDIAVLASRLQARLGKAALQSPIFKGDHLPEDFAQYQPVEINSLLDKHSNHCPLPLHAQKRPHWLLAKPKVISRDHFKILQGPERITTAWWESKGFQRRDYYQALCHDNRVAWVFRDDQGAWYLQGWFS